MAGAAEGISAVTPEKDTESLDTDRPPKSESPDADFFHRNTELGAEIIEGMVREQQIMVFGRPYGVGKTPWLTDLTVHVLNGREWLGRAVQKRPVIVFDFESSASAYKSNVKNIAARLGVSVPRVPDELEVYLEHDRPLEPSTTKLLDLLKSKDLKTRLDFVEDVLKRKPNSLVIIDPMEMLFRIDTTKKLNILILYTELRLLLSRYPHAAVLLTFNMRKQNQGNRLPDLLSEPRAFLEEVCGTLDILNRCDVRVGMNINRSRGGTIRVINGIRRNEDFDPLIIQPTGEPGNLAGFKLLAPSSIELESVLTAKQLEHWNKLEEHFTWSEAERLVPRATLSRLLKLAKSIGALEHELSTNIYFKVAV